MTDQRAHLDAIRAKGHLADGHDHTLPIDPATHKPAVYATREEELAARRANCPACRIHDHTDRRTFALTRDREPLPGHLFRCPGCDPTTARALVNEWTPAGIAWLRGHEAA